MRTGTFCVFISAVLVVMGLTGSASAEAEDWRPYIRASGVSVFSAESDVKTVVRISDSGTAETNAAIASWRRGEAVNVPDFAPEVGQKRFNAERLSGDAVKEFGG